MDGEGRYELGATGHGPNGVLLAERLVEQIRRWDRDRAAQPVITACPAGAAGGEVSSGGLVINKRTIRMIVVP